MVMSATTPQAIPLRGRHILVVDDEALNLALMSRLLGSQAYRVTTVSSGTAALAAADDTNVDLMLVDMMMPGMDGIELCDLIRRAPARTTLPVIFMSGLTDRESRIRAKEAGADDYLTKPVDALELLVRVETLLRVHMHHQNIERRERQLAIELERAMAHLMRLERLSAVGSLAAGVGRELGSLSDAFRSSLGALHSAHASGSVVENSTLRELDRVGHDLGQHAEQLMRLGRPESAEAETIALDAVVADVLNLVRASGRAAHVTLKHELPSPSPMLHIVRTDLEQVLINLVLNAADALTEVRDRDPQICVRVASADTLGRVRVQVTDNGTGIATGHLARVFEPYFSTKPYRRGAGMGLPLVRHLVESSGGRVVLVSVPGEGTTFTVDFPSCVT